MITENSQIGSWLVHHIVRRPRVVGESHVTRGPCKGIGSVPIGRVPGDVVAEAEDVLEQAVDEVVRVIHKLCRPPIPLRLQG